MLARLPLTSTVANYTSRFMALLCRTSKPLSAAKQCFLSQPGSPRASKPMSSFSSWWTSTRQTPSLRDVNNAIRSDHQCPQHVHVVRQLGRGDRPCSLQHVPRRKVFLLQQLRLHRLLVLRYTSRSSTWQNDAAKASATTAMSIKSHITDAHTCSPSSSMTSRLRMHLWRMNQRHYTTYLASRYHRAL